MENNALHTTILDYVGDTHDELARISCDAHSMLRKRISSEITRLELLADVCEMLFLAPVLSHRGQ